VNDRYRTFLVVPSSPLGRNTNCVADALGYMLREDERVVSVYAVNDGLEVLVEGVPLSHRVDADVHPSRSPPCCSVTGACAHPLASSECTRHCTCDSPSSEEMEPAHSICWDPNDEDD